MTTFVLVHGAWGGSYGFAEVRRRLHRQGHDVFTPSLTGIGERSHLVSPSVGLDTHIKDVVNTILYEDLHDIVLLGFSYGGMVVTGALEQIAARVQQLVYLDALLPGDGQSAYTLLKLKSDPDPAAIDIGSTWLVPPRPREGPTLQATAWANARRSMQPLKTLTDTVTLGRALEQWPFGLTYIKATDDPDERPDSAFWQAAQRTKAAAAQPAARWRYYEVDSNHMIPANKPDELVEILTHLAP